MYRDAGDKIMWNILYIIEVQENGLLGEFCLLLLVTHMNWIISIVSFKNNLHNISVQNLVTLYTS